MTFIFSHYNTLSYSMSPLLENQCKEDQNKIPILIILATIGYYPTARCEKKISCRTSSLSKNCYITELLLYNHPRRVHTRSNANVSTNFTSTSSIARVDFTPGIVDNLDNKLLVDVICSGIESYPMLEDA